MSCGEVRWWTDAALQEAGVVVVFSERTGGVSDGVWHSLNLAAHVGDDSAAVDANRGVLLDALGLNEARDRLTVAEQVHGDRIYRVAEAEAGRGAFATGGEPPVRSTDALLTSLPRVPLLLCFADCVPVILVAPGPAVCAVHAGWRGCAAKIASQGVLALAEEARCEPSEVRAYVGAHIGPCHYEVDARTLSHFVNTFGTVARAESGGLDLGAVVTTDLTDAGVDSCNIARLGICTAEATDRFYSYRAEGGVTGRHGALVCIL